MDEEIKIGNKSGIPDAGSVSLGGVMDQSEKIMNQNIELMKRLTTALTEIERLKEFEWMYNDLCK